MCPTTLSVFEHGTLRVGTVTAKGALTQAQFEALARFNDVHGQRYFRLGHQRLTFGSFVGYLQVGTLGIEILPKLDRQGARANEHADWQRFLLEMLRVSIGLPLQSPTDAMRRIGRPTLLELVALRFLDEVERLLHGGLAKGYRDVEANGTTFRGRLLGAPHVRANFARADRFYVRYSAFDRDIPINCALGTALRVLSELALNPTVRARVATSALLFPDMPTTAMCVENCDRIVLTRSTQRYRNALTLARMILAHQAPELYAGGNNVFAVLFDMNALWERYVGWLFRRAAPKHCDVALQESCDFWQAHRSSPRRVRPDLILRDRTTKQTLVVADAKWKALRDTAPAADDLKQMFVYNNLFGTTQSVLVYPTVGAGHYRLDGRYSDRAHHCGTMEIGLFDGSMLRTETMLEQVRNVLAQLM